MNDQPTDLTKSLIIDEDDEKSPPHQLDKTLSFWHLVALSYFLVSAGPFGQEEAIRAGGGLLVFISTLLVPLLYSLPLGLIASEQSTRLPACGGAIEWASILGRPITYINCYVRLLRAVVDTALYPVMIADYILSLLPQFDKLYIRALITIASNLIVICINYFGAETVGVVSFLLSFIIVTPFVLYVIFAAKYLTPSRVFAKYPSSLGSPDYSLLLSTLIWQFSGFDSIGALSSEVKNPKRNFPLAMLITIFLVTTVYLMPTLAGVASEPDLTQWSTGSFSSNSTKLPHCQNGWLGIWISISGAFSSLSLLGVILTCTGRELYACGVLNTIPFPTFFTKLTSNNKNHLIPMRGIITMAVLTFPFCFFDFSMIIEWTGLLTVLGELIQIIIFIACRIPGYLEGHSGVFKKIQDIEEENQPADSGASSYQPLTQDLEDLKSIDSNDNNTISNDSIDNNNTSNDSNAQKAKKEKHEKSRIGSKEEIFEIGCGWFGVILVVLPLGGLSIFLCVVQGWKSLLISFGLVFLLFILELIFLGSVSLKEQQSWA